MILCSVCHAENSHLATVCTGCGSFLQQRVENLDLFSCAWSVLEKPARGFRTIALARHKNGILLLSAVAGVAFVFGFFWLAKMGEYAQNLINILGAGLALAVPVGIATVLFLSFMILLVSRALRLQVRFRDVYAVAAYASVPLILTAVFFLPIEVLSFGSYFFSQNPSPYSIRPFSYVTLLALDGAFAAWSVILLFVGVRVLFDAGWMKSGAAVLAALLLAGLTVAGVMQMTLPRV
jgi:Yip1-like protein